jgi:hypothetical protein
MAENDIQDRIRLRIGSQKGLRVFRNNTGLGWSGNASVRINQSGPYYCNNGDMIIRSARPLHAGLIKGSSDLIGWKTVTITQDMVGSTVAVFVAVEVKTEKGRPTPDQQNFIDMVLKSGGIAGIVRSEEEAENLVK